MDPWTHSDTEIKREAIFFNRFVVYELEVGGECWFTFKLTSLDLLSITRYVKVSYGDNIIVKIVY